MNNIIFTKTHEKHPDSSLVESIFYNYGNAQVLVALVSGQSFRYHGVPFNDYLFLANASSVGAEFNSFKREFGPGDKYQTEDVIVTSENSRGHYVLKALTYADGSVSSADAVTSANTVAAEKKGYTTLEVAPSPEAVRSALRTMVVSFDSTLGNEKTSVVKAETIEDAVLEVASAAAVLGIPITVKKVTVHFE